MSLLAQSSCCTHNLWMKQTLQDVHIEYNDPITILYDNTSAINISKNPVMHSKTKHIPIKYHFVRDHVLEKTIKLEHIGKEQVADIFKKPLQREEFEYLRQNLGVITTPH